MNEFKCPICGGDMETVNGDGLNPKNGYTVVCTSMSCPCHENVYGHGNTAKAAYEIAKQKFVKVD